MGSSIYFQSAMVQFIKLYLPSVRGLRIYKINKGDEGLWTGESIQEIGTEKIPQFSRLFTSVLFGGEAEACRRDENDSCIFDSFSIKKVRNFY